MYTEKIAINLHKGTNVMVFKVLRSLTFLMTLLEVTHKK